MTSMVWLHSAHAQEMQPSARQQTSTSQPFTIPASDLGTALLRAGAIAEVRIVFDPRRLAGIETTGLAGRFTLDEALSRLLHGTGLRHRMDEQGSVRLEEASPAAGLKQPAVASEAVPQSLLAAALDEVVVVAPAELDRPAKDDAYRVARSTSVMTRDDIERSRGTSVGDIFKGATGVLVGENRNSGGLDINIRGMQGQGRVPILVDGARQETTVYRGYSGVASRSYIDPDLIGGIQIDKGPVMSAEGTGATGGLVSMRTINADDIVQPGKDFGLRLRGQAIGNNSGASVAPGTSAGLFMGRPGDSGHVYRTDCVTPSICTPALPNEWGHPEGRNRPSTFDFKNWAGSVAAAKRLETIDLVAAYAQRRQGNYYAGKHGPTAWMDVSDTRKLPFYTEVRPAIQGATIFEGGERIPGSNFQSKSGMLKAKAFLPADQELELSYLRYSSAYAELMPSQILRFSGLNPVSQPYDSDVTVDTYTSRYRWNPSENPLIDLRANLWHTFTDASNNNPFSDDLDEGTRQEYRRTGLDVTNTSTLHHPGRWGESQLRYGLSVQSEDVRYVLPEGTQRAGGPAGNNGDRDEYSAFAAWQYKPTPSITFDAGLRHTRFKSFDLQTVFDPTSPRCVDTDGDGTCDPLPHHNKRSGTAPIVSLTWEPGNSGLQLYGRYAEAYRMPSLFESTFSARPDISLNPEHARNKEIGINFLKDGLLRSGDKLRLKFAYFRNHTSDYLTRTSPNLWEEGVDENRFMGFTMRNIDSAAFGGIELSGSYDMGAIFTEFGVTKYNRIEICHTGSYRIYQCNNYGIANSYINNMVPPNWHGNLTLGTRLLERKLVLGVRGIFMGQRNNTPQYNDDTDHGFLKVVPWHAYRTFDFFASYKVSDRVSIDFNLDNFTDRYYLDALSLGLIPAPGRTARLGVTLQF
ncbi:hemoglobin/transferrin/lactoferrin receptor protein [Lampropedia hyalina DSM 16112]|jgi:hemoglobin/transferrin/lactoferrin receptor protein|uniref:Hemoglobin/transferrin/lactoferrin receptor protein n=1 Tax=Lampropedia hyalina DSM 16112 TaxID=1122156 RepID=A0A1M4UEX0_9BURK|nr:TonB-dependent receptor [Lampropedia hyalina]SHE55351.1 hemoglobin/transferrin/lactoferrin receptor protein [Lampropedia hyalina DSM 16112]